jgi:hypothetical protein
MHMRRTARQHETIRSEAGVQSEDYADFKMRERVMTCDGYPGRITAIHDGPYPGNEAYEVMLDGGMGGGLYTSGQLRKAADEAYTATQDYPELAAILSERPDPAKHVITATTQNGHKIDDHGEAPHKVRAQNPNDYDDESTEGDPDPKMTEPLTKRDETGAKGGELAKGMSGMSHEGAMSPAAEQHVKDREDARQDVVDQHVTPKQRQRDRTTAEDVMRREDPQYAESLHVGVSWNDPEHGADWGRGDPFAAHEPSHWVDPENGRDHQLALDFDESGKCMVGHEGPCPVSMSHESRLVRAMPHINHPDPPEGFDYKVMPNHGDSGHLPAMRVGTHVMHGYVNGEHVGTLHHSVSDDGKAVKVDMLHTDRTGSAKGAASALTDALYDHYPQAYVNHGWRTADGVAWHNNYESPDPHRDVHQAHPEDESVHEGGWQRYFNPHKVASDMWKNHYADDDGEGQHPAPHFNPEDYESAGHEKVGGQWEKAHAAQARSGLREEGFDSSGVDAQHDRDMRVGRETDEEGTKTYQPDPRNVELHHGTSVYLSPHDHAIVHDSKIDPELRAHHLLNAMGRGNLPQDGAWHDSRKAAEDAADRSAQAQSAGATHPPTHVVLSTSKMKHSEAFDGDKPRFNDYGHQVDFNTDEHPTLLHVGQMTWKPHGSRGDEMHMFSENDYRGEQMATKPDPSHHSTAWGTSEYHPPEWYHSVAWDKPTGLEHAHQEKLFASLAAAEHQFPEAPDDEGDDLADVVTPGHQENWYERVPTTMGYSAPARPGGAESTDPEHSVRWSYPYPEKKYQQFSTSSLADPYELIALAAADSELSFHFTAAWSDVRAKAKRIRSEGKVRITAASEGLVIGEVAGDTHTYETGLQRRPGQRQSVANWSCGCKWGAYHWGAPDDFSRFAGRMCSHALALQYEAQSQGMFGKEVNVHTIKPDWVPSNIVVKYDIDERENQMGRSSALDVRPIDAFRMYATLQGHSAEIIALLVQAATNNPFGERVVEVPPKPYGATQPHDKGENPASAGLLAQPDPDGWGNLDIGSLMPMAASLDEAIFEPGAEATLHEEPEGALPETDGNLEDADLEPKDQEIQTTGTVSVAEALAISKQVMLNAEAERMALAEREANQVGGDDEVMDEVSASPSEDADDVVSRFQATSAAAALMSSGPAESGGYSDGDIAAMAKQALKSFSPAEQAALINEGIGERASNLDRLDIKGTHYAELDEEDEPWL